MKEEGSSGKTISSCSSEYAIIRIFPSDSDFPDEREESKLFSEGSFFRFFLFFRPEDFGFLSIDNFERSCECPRGEVEVSVIGNFAFWSSCSGRDLCFRGSFFSPSSEASIMHANVIIDTRQKIYFISTSLISLSCIIDKINRWRQRWIDAER